MLVVIATVQAQADKADELARLVALLAIAYRQDAGCQSYSFYRDVEDPTLFCAVETWDSRADLDAHLAAPHTADLLSKLPALVASAPIIQAHEIASTDQLA